jgi:putative redox protein
MSESEEKKIIHVHLPLDEQFKTTLTAGKHTIIADEPVSVKGGKDQGPDPYDMLLMSLGACTVMTVKMYARRKKWPLEDLYVELRQSKGYAEDCSNCEDPDSKIDVIEKELIIKGDLTEEQKEKFLDISKKCPVHKTLLGDIDIKSTLSRDSE